MTIEIHVDMYFNKYQGQFISPQNDHKIILIKDVFLAHQCFFNDFKCFESDAWKTVSIKDKDLNEFPAHLYHIIHLKWLEIVWIKDTNPNVFPAHRCHIIHLKLSR